MKTALVTGGNRGIGLEICRQLDEHGYTVILCSRDIDKGREAAGSLSKNVFAGQLDVTDEASIASLFEVVSNRFGKIDVLINNAGIGARNEPAKNTLTGKAKHLLESNFKGVFHLAQRYSKVLRKAGIGIPMKGAKDIALQGVKEIMDTNFYGPWRMIQVFLPLLLKSEEGRIINISSGMGQLQSLTGIYPGYSLSKSSLNALTIMFSNELKEQGIKVNAMCPGWVRTDMGGPNAPLHVSQGADTAVWLTTEKEIPTGKFFRERHEIPW